MRFCATGADIPNDLINAVNDGSVTFICGAGVSKRADLPLFEDLTKRVYARLGETWADKAPERIAIQAEQYDRALRALEKRTHFPRADSPVRTAVAEELRAPPSADLGAHLALLRLSRDSGGAPRLVTTNFDTLFERAAVAGGMDNVETYSGKAIPRAGTPKDAGIFHLHGCIGGSDPEVAASELILTSADFGDAYLRDGWASQYIEDRMRVGALVLIGYQAEDAAMRLLLETLDADRQRFRDLQPIYAMDKKTKDSTSVWESKGIRPIEFASFDGIYETLREWAEYAADPRRYAAAHVKSILLKTTAAP